MRKSPVKLLILGMTKTKELGRKKKNNIKIVKIFAFSINILKITVSRFHATSEQNIKQFTFS